MKTLIEKVEKLSNQIKLNEFLSNKRIVLEQGESHKCSRTEVGEIKLIFNTFPEIKEKYKKGINKILKRVFRDKYKIIDGTYGVYDLETPGRSVINKLNTNYNCFCILNHDVNKLLLRNGVNPINLVGLNPQEMLQETDRFISILDTYGERIFNQSSNTYKNVMSTLGVTHEKGEKTENIAIQIMKKHFGDDNVIKFGELGGRIDMIGGVDVIVKHNGKELLGQIKPLEKIENRLGNYFLFGTGQIKKYDVDWLIFLKGNSVYIFENNETKIVDGIYVFPNSSLVYTL